MRPAAIRLELPVLNSTVLWQVWGIAVIVALVPQVWSRFPCGPVVKSPPANGGDVSVAVQPLGWEDPLEEDTATHSSILAWRIPETEEPSGLMVHSVAGVRQD